MGDGGGVELLLIQLINILQAQLVAKPLPSLIKQLSLCQKNLQLLRQNINVRLVVEQTFFGLKTFGLKTAYQTAQQKA